MLLSQFQNLLFQRTCQKLNLIHSPHSTNNLFGTLLGSNSNYSLIVSVSQLASSLSLSLTVMILFCFIYPKNSLSFSHSSSDSDSSPRLFAPKLPSLSLTLSHRVLCLSLYISFSHTLSLSLPTIHTKSHKQIPMISLSPTLKNISLSL